MGTAVFYKKILDAEGIENRVFEYAPGRADLWAQDSAHQPLRHGGRSFC